MRGQFFSLMKFNLLIFFFHASCFFVLQSRRYLPLSNTKMLIHLILSQVLIDLTFLFTYMINLDSSQNKLHLQSQTGINFFLRTHTGIFIFLVKCTENNFFPPWKCLAIFAENHLIIYVWACGSLSKLSIVLLFFFYS